MGTNYYIHKNKCDQCGRYEEIHLGKSSHGWQFIFNYNGGEYYKTVEEMYKWLRRKTIYNEYGEKITLRQFKEMVQEKQANPENKNHVEYAEKNHGKREHTFKIDEYAFINSEFS